MDIRSELERIALLARLDPNEMRHERMESDLKDMISMMDKLSELDLASVADELNTEFVNAFREDETSNIFTREELLRNAPVSEAGCIAVPRVME